MRPFEVVSGPDPVQLSAPERGRGSISRRCRRVCAAWDRRCGRHLLLRAVDLCEVNLRDPLGTVIFRNEVHHVGYAFPKTGCRDLARFCLLSFQTDLYACLGIFLQEIVHAPALFTMTSNLFYFSMTHICNPFLRGGGAV